MATVIDSLLVTLGLDSKPYKKGADDATRSQKGLKEGIKKSSGEMVQSLKSVALQVGAMVVGFNSLRGAVQFLAGINNADAALGRLAANTGTNVRELNEWALAVELAGGSLDDAKADVTALASSITALKATGTVSELLLLMQRLGVATFDAEGNTRDLFTIMSEAGAKLSQFNRADAFQLGKGAGLSEGTLNLLLMEEDARRRIFAQAQANNNLDQAAAERAADLQRQWRDMTQGAREFGREILESVTPAIVALMSALKPAGESLTETLKGLNDARVFESLATALNAVAAGLERLVGALPRAQRFTTDMLEAVTAPGGIASTDGIRNAAIVEAVKWLLQTDRGGSKGPKSGTAVQIDNIEINTQATDAEGIAAELPGALTRKGVVAQADTGMN
jgi:hypothetical protein